jgi:hypothetical protein
MITLLGTFLLIDKVFGPPRRRSFPMRILNGFKIGTPAAELLFMAESLLAPFLGPNVKSNGIMAAATTAFVTVQKAVQKGMQGGEDVVLEILTVVKESKAVKSVMDSANLVVPSGDDLRALYRKIRQRVVDASIAQAATAAITMALLGYVVKRVRRRGSKR